MCNNPENLKMSVKVSVIIPCYNVEKYVEECLISVYDQTYKDFEVILVNDGSTDGTEMILFKYKNKYSEKTKYINIENSGPSSARNKGMRIASGEFICFMDSDDILTLDSIEKRVLVLLEDKEIGLVCSDSFMIDEDIKTQEKLSSKIGSVYSGYIFPELLKKNFVSTQTVLMRREIIDDIGYFDETYIRSEDYEYWLRISHKYKVKYLNDILAYTRVRKGSLSTDKKNEMEISQISVYKSILFNYKLSESEKKILGKRLNDVLYYLNLRLANEYFVSKNIKKSKECMYIVLKSKKRFKHAFIYLMLLLFPKLLIRYSKFYYKDVKMR